MILTNYHGKYGTATIGRLTFLDAPKYICREFHTSKYRCTFQKEKYYTESFACAERWINKRINTK